MLEISRRNPKRLLLALAAVLTLALGVVFVLPSQSSEVVQGEPRGDVAPHFEVDPFWPKPLPNNWVLGQVAGIEVDQHDRIWIVQRPGSLTGADLRGNSPAPPVMAFDANGNLLEAWGPEASEEGPREWAGCEFPVNEHGIWIDDEDNVWLAGNGGDDHVALKFTSDGSECLLQIGEWGNAGDNDSETLLNRPADGDTDDAAREVYIADGYGNNRVAVFDMDTGEFKRSIMSDDEEAPWGTPVHCAVLSDDDLVYICDRPNNRVHVTDKEGNYLEEIVVADGTPGNGSTWDLDFSVDRAQTFLYDADGENQRVHILRRSDAAEEGVIAEFGRGGRYAGMFHWVHNLSTDSSGNIYTAEVSEGKRTQKFDFRGYRPVD